jgi:hypothetical protein
MTESLALTGGRASGEYRYGLSPQPGETALLFGEPWIDLRCKRARPATPMTPLYPNGYLVMSAATTVAITNCVVDRHGLHLSMPSMPRRIVVKTSSL